MKQAGSELDDLVRRADLARRASQALAQADALRALAEHRHRAHWAIAGVETLPGFLNTHSAPEATVDLSTPSEGEDIAADYAAVGLTLRHHPLALL